MDVSDYNVIRRGLVLVLFVLAGGVVWAYFCQQSLATGRWSVRSLLGLFVAAAVALQLGLLFLEAVRTID